MALRMKYAIMYNDFCCCRHWLRAHDVLPVNQEKPESVIQKWNLEEIKKERYPFQSSPLIDLKKQKYRKVSLNTKIVAIKTIIKENILYFVSKWFGPHVSHHVTVRTSPNDKVNTAAAIKAPFSLTGLFEARTAWCGDLLGHSSHWACLLHTEMALDTSPPTQIIDRQ